MTMLADVWPIGGVMALVAAHQQESVAMTGDCYTPERYYRRRRP